MRRSYAALGSALWFLLAPGLVAGLVPWLLTGWRPAAAPGWVRGAGALLVVLGAVVLVYAFVQFVVEGFGTPAPAAAPGRLVVGGLYRHVRNPMYLGVIATIVGQTMLLGRWSLIWYAVVVTLVELGFVYGYEQPALRRTFGRQYQEYCRAVPAWWPRLTPWRPDTP